MSQYVMTVDLPEGTKVDDVLAAVRDAGSGMKVLSSEPVPPQNRAYLILTRDVAPDTKNSDLPTTWNDPDAKKVKVGGAFYDVWLTQVRSEYGDTPEGPEYGLPF